MRFTLPGADATKVDVLPKISLNFWVAKETRLGLFSGKPISLGSSRKTSFFIFLTFSRQIPML
jgi:hypothetical protein